MASSWPMPAERASAMRAAPSVSTAGGTETGPVDAAGHIDAAALAAAAAPASGAAACAASAGVALASDAHCAVLASIERSVSWTLGAGVIGVAGFSVHA
ncbi:hypothetical protein [Burkholderia ubonensis]|uniref:hypothetical protein n=1 Tax=Burkholderia ubonensis TaxID=101571 RepID=UPI001474D40B